MCYLQDNYRYKCSECGRLFLQRCDMKRHMLIHTKQEPHRCTVCDKGNYETNYTLLFDTQKLNKPRRRYSLGPFIFWENIYTVQKYIWTVAHWGGGDLSSYFSFVLGMISELNSMYFYSGYIRKSDLVVHMRFHSKERAYKCNHCEKQFFQSGIKLLLWVLKKEIWGIPFVNWSWTFHFARWP